MNGNRTIHALRIILREILAKSDSSLSPTLPCLPEAKQHAEMESLEQTVSKITIVHK